MGIANPPYIPVFGTGAPGVLAAPNGVLYFDTTSTPYVAYIRNAGAWVQFTPSVSYTPTIPPQGRLTLTTAVPVLTADVLAATTIFYTPYQGNIVPIYDGTAWTVFNVAEMSQATTDATKSPAACAANSVYDLFVWNDAGTRRCTRGPAWTSATGRGTGAGTTELIMQDGLLVNKIAITNGPGAKLGTYVGTVATDAASKCNMMFNPAGAAGGGGNRLDVWNAYNRVKQISNNFDNTDSWNYTTETWRLKNNNANNEIIFVSGLPDVFIAANNTMSETNSSNNILKCIGIGLDSITVVSALASISNVQGNGAGAINPSVALLFGPPGIGRHFVAPLEISAATGTTTWYGDNGASLAGAGAVLSKFSLEIFG